MLKESLVANYENNKDIRYVDGDEVSLFHLDVDSAGTIVWTQALDRTLKQAI